jgi:DNA-binding transcriptional LysR family regulator
MLDDDTPGQALAGARPTTEAQPEDLALNPVRLAVFRTVVERHGFTRAAEALYLTQSTVSDHIRVLEELFGSPLFDRRRRGAQLTEVGQAVYAFAVTMQRELGALRAQISDLTGGQAGVLTLGAPIVPGTHVLPSLLAGFYHRHPAGQLLMRLLPPDAIGEAVLNGHLDLGVISEAETIAPVLQVEPLWRESVVLIAPPDHRLAEQPRVALRDLVDEAFVVAWGRLLGDQALNRALARAGLPPRRIVMAVGNQDGVRQAVLERVGLGVVFRRVVAADLTSGQLAALPLEDLPMSEQFLLVYRRAHRLTPLAQRFITFLREESPRLSE